MTALFRILFVTSLLIHPAETVSAQFHDSLHAAVADTLLATGDHDQQSPDHGSHEAAVHAESADHASGAKNTVDVLEKLKNHSYLDFKPVGKIELPRIFYTNRGILWYPGTSTAIASGLWVDDHGMVTGADGHEHPATYHISPAEGSGIEVIVDLSLSSHLVYFWVAGLLTLIIFLSQVSKYSRGIGRTEAPKGAMQNLLETLVLFVRDDVAKPNIGAKYAKFTPYLLTAFFMILFMNLFGLVPWGVSSTADVTVTAALALTTFVVTQFSASKDHWAHVFWFPGVPAWIRIILTPVEIIGLFTKPFALCIRLFANMASGKVLIYSIIGLIFVFSNLFGSAIAYGTSWLWVLFALFIYIIKVVVAFLQAYIFTMLSSLFIGMAVAEHHHEEHAHEAH